MENNQTVPTPDDRLMAALSLALGWIVALVIWAIQKEKSAFVRFHTLQAMSFDLLTIPLSLLIMFCSWMVGLGAMFFAVPSLESLPARLDSDISFMYPWMMFMMILLCTMPFNLLIILVRFIAATKVFSGKDFRYPWLGKKLENYLKATP